MEGTPMSLNPGVEDHFVTMVIHSALFTSLSVSALTGAHRLIQKSPTYSGMDKMFYEETIQKFCSRAVKTFDQLLMVSHSYP